MTYAIITADQITAHGDYRTLWANTSFSAAGPNAEFLAENNAVAIRSDLPHDAETQQLQPCPPYLLDGVVYNVEAVTRPPAPEPVPEPQWIAFQRDVMSTPAVNGMLGATLQAAPAVGLALAVGLGQVAQGGDARTFLEAWGAGIALELISAELAATIATLATTHDLPGEFIAALNPE
jgi:hypothetical protein